MPGTLGQDRVFKRRVFISQRVIQTLEIVSHACLRPPNLKIDVMAS